MSSFSTYIIGFIILVIGLALAAYLLNVPAMWIAVGVVVLIGIGGLMGTRRTQPTAPPAVGLGVRSQESGIRDGTGAAASPQAPHQMSAAASLPRLSIPDP